MGKTIFDIVQFSATEWRQSGRPIVKHVHFALTSHTPSTARRSVENMRLSDSRAKIGAKTIDMGLGGNIQFKDSSGAVGCTICSITEDHLEAVVVSSDPRISAKGNVELEMFLPTERSPIRCTGRSVWFSPGAEQFRAYNGYMARVVITQISRIDRRRLEVVTVQKKAFMTGGFGLNPCS